MNKSVPAARTALSDLGNSMARGEQKSIYAM